MYEAELFLKRIVEQPDDDAPRLVFADWLEEQGDPRGEFIRLQCALAAGTFDPEVRRKMGQREQQLLDGKLNAWGAKPFRGIARRCSFRRGFIESISITAGSFLDHADDLFDWAPLRRIRITELPRGDVDRLAKSPALARVRELDLTGDDLHDAGVEALMCSPHLQRLRWLNLSVNGLSDRSWNLLAGLTAQPALDWLDLSHNHFRHLPAKLTLQNLTGLDIGHNDCTADALLPLHESRVKQLKISGNPIGDEKSPAIVHQMFQKVAANGMLELADCGLSTTFIAALAASPNRRTLRTLKLERNAVGDDGLITLARTPGFEQLSRLELCANGITDRGALILAKSELFRRLEHLDLQQNQLSSAGIEALWASENRRFCSMLLLGQNIPPEPVEDTLPEDAALPIFEGQDDDE